MSYANYASFKEKKGSREKQTCPTATCDPEAVPSCRFPPRWLPSSLPGRTTAAAHSGWRSKGGGAPPPAHMVPRPPASPGPGVWAVWPQSKVVPLRSPASPQPCVPFWPQLRPTRLLHQKPLQSGCYGDGAAAPRPCCSVSSPLKVEWKSGWGDPLPLILKEMLPPSALPQMPLVWRGGSEWTPDGG